MRIKPALRKRINEQLRLLTTNVYFDHLPMVKVANILESHGLNTDGMEGIYCGHEGRATSLVAENSMVVMTWYRMPSNKFEFCVYLS